MRGVFLFLLLAVGAPIQAQQHSIALHDGWSFQRLGDTAWHTAEVPGVVHTDLMRHGLIPDPYVGFNADSVQWIENEDWVYRRALNITDSILRNEHVELVFKGLDTFADVYLNDSLVLKADNMFRTWERDVKPFLQPGPNELKVIFRSAVREGAERRDAYGIQLPHDNDPSGVSPYVRKAAYHFGWDFAPRLVTCGIWQAVELRTWNTVRLAGMQVGRQPEGNGYRLHFVPDIQGFAPNDQRIVIRLNGEKVIDERLPGHGHGRHPDLLHVVEAPQRWWPTGYGEQPLYTVEAELWEDQRLLGLWNGTIGLREVELVRTEEGEDRPFTFRINGTDVFAKGCNLVPPDMFLPRAGDAGWLRLVRAMQDAHMNMVRVWAGGVYPPDAFFHACDTAGILVWQDLMVANLIAGPADEVAEQCRRLAPHPSLAVICGNNEVDVAWKHWGWQQRYGLHGADSTRAWDDYAYERTSLHSAAAITLAGVPFVGTSPLSNWGNAEGLRSGDLHYWGVWHADSTFASYERNIGRFMSEYGFQSYPDSSLLAQYLAPDQLHLGSAGLKYRQRSYRIDRPIIEAIRRELGIDPDTLTLGGFCAASQEVQALAYGIAARAHLAARPHCMGTLVWQLNDVWPGPSWSLIDHSGHRKPAFDAIRTAYAVPADR